VESERTSAMYSDVPLFIDGHWTEAAGGRTIPVVNPATGEPIGTVAHADKSDLDRALEAADKGFRVWRKVSAFDLSKVMRKAANLLRERVDAIGPLLTSNREAAARFQGRDARRRRCQARLFDDQCDGRDGRNQAGERRSSAVAHGAVDNFHEWQGSGTSRRYGCSRNQLGKALVRRLSRFGRPVADRRPGLAARVTGGAVL